MTGGRGVPSQEYAWPSATTGDRPQGSFGQQTANYWQEIHMECKFKDQKNMITTLHTEWIYVLKSRIVFDTFFVNITPKCRHQSKQNINISWACTFCTMHIILYPEPKQAFVEHSYVIPVSTPGRMVKEEGLCFLCLAACKDICPHCKLVHFCSQDHLSLHRWWWLWWCICWERQEDWFLMKNIFQAWHWVPAFQGWQTPW